MNSRIERIIFMMSLLLSAQCSAIDIQALPFFKASISGRIEANDTQKLATFLKKQKSPITILVLDSPGGNVDEAIRLGELIKFAMIGTEIQSEKICTSSCFFVFLAGSDRSASPSRLMQPGELEQLYAAARKVGVTRKVEVPGFVGLHRPFYIETAIIEKYQNSMMEHVSLYLKKQMISARLIDVMMTHPSNDIYWLSESDLKEIGSYPPQQEEVFIQRCGYDRNANEKQIQAIEQGRTAKADEIFERQLQANMCIQKLKEKLAIGALEKIRSGWLPPISRIATVN